MSNLEKPKFKTLPYSSFGGAPLLKTLWDQFDFSLLLTQSGIFKQRGVPTWQFAFLFVIGLLARCTSCLKTVEFYSKDSLLQRMFQSKIVSQSAFSRFMASSFRWDLFNIKRVARFQQDPVTRLENGDIVALDDTLVPHDHAKKMPFVYRLFDHCTKAYVQAMNLVVLHAVKASGLQYPLFYSVWKQDDGETTYSSKLDLALELLQRLKSQVSQGVRLWVAMDSWYFTKDLCQSIEELEFDWVTRAKSSKTLYRRVVIRGKERFIQILPEALFTEAKPYLSLFKRKGLVCMGFSDIYVQIDEIHKGRGYRKEPVLKPINAVVTAYLEEDEETSESKQLFALLLSNRADAKAAEIVKVYKKRWCIEIFFRNAKQELGLNECHSTHENHIHAHLSLLFVAETLVRYAQWDFNEKTDTKEEVTHGQVVALLFHTRCEVRAKHGDSIQVYFDTVTQQFASFFERYWPRICSMVWFSVQKIGDYLH